MRETSLRLMMLAVVASAGCRGASPPAPSPSHRIGLPGGAAQPVQITDSVGRYSASIVDAGGGVYGLQVVP